MPPQLQRSTVEQESQEYILDFLLFIGDLIDKGMRIKWFESMQHTMHKCHCFWNRVVSFYWHQTRNLWYCRDCMGCTWIVHIGAKRIWIANDLCPQALAGRVAFFPYLALSTMMTGPKLSCPAGVLLSSSIGYTEAWSIRSPHVSFGAMVGSSRWASLTLQAISRYGIWKRCLDTNPKALKCPGSSARICILDLAGSSVVHLVGAVSALVRYLERLLEAEAQRTKSKDPAKDVRGLRCCHCIFAVERPNPAPSCAI